MYRFFVHLAEAGAESRNLAMSHRSKKMHSVEYGVHGILYTVQSVQYTVHSYTNKQITYVPIDTVWSKQSQRWIYNT